MSVPQVLSQEETIGLLLVRSQRPHARVPLRETFVQKRTPSGTRKGGPLTTLVRDARGLELLLLTHAVASAGDFSVTEWATTWARTIGLFDPASGPTAVSRTWKRLEDGRLIRRARGQGGKAQITVLREDGSGRKYTHPHKNGERYFQLPFEYWTAPERWYASLTMPGKVMLLVTLSLREEEFSLPQDKVPDWYEISADTAGRGLVELQDRGILSIVREHLFPSLQSKTGYAARNIYRFMPPFDLKARGMGIRRRSRKRNS
jgi:hypothetical protein